MHVLSELAASFGWFALGSGSAWVVGHSTHRNYNDTSFRGTFFGMQFQSTPADISSVVHDIIDTAEEEVRLVGVHLHADELVYRRQTCLAILAVRCGAVT